MKDFNFYAPTRVVFGKQSEEQLPRLLKEAGGKKVLVHYGKGSVKRRQCQALRTVRQGLRHA